MKNQILFLLAGMSLLLSSAAAEAEDMIGAIMSAPNIPYYMAIQKGLEEELTKAGVGAKVGVQKPAPNEMAWKNSARKLVTLEAKAIIAYGASVALAAKSEAPDLPVAYVAAFDPAGAGLSGGNVTGVEAKVPLQALIGQLKKISNFTKLGILFSSDEPGSVQQADAVAALAGDSVKTDVKGGAISLPDGVQAVFLTCAGDVQNEDAIKAIVEKARAGKIATASVFSGSAELGVMITLAASAEQQAQELAKIVAGLLKGGGAAGSPAVSGSKAELTINLVEAKALGLTVPFELLGTAKVIK